MLVTGTGEMTLVKDGKARFRIVTKDGLGRISKVGPTDSANFTKEARGATVKVVPFSKLQDEKDDFVNVYVGPSLYVMRFPYEYPKSAGFRIIFPDDKASSSRKSHNTQTRSSIQTTARYGFLKGTLMQAWA